MDAAVQARLRSAAFLEFRMVHPESNELLAQGIVEPGYEVSARSSHTDRSGNQAGAMSYLVKKGAEQRISRASI